MPKFFFDVENLDGEHLCLHGETAHHIVNVLRYKVGDEVILCDGNCTDYFAKLISFETRKKVIKARLEVTETKKCLSEPPIFVRLYQSAIKWESFDFAIQKSVEIGASEIVPVVTERSMYKISDVNKKAERLNRIAKSAAEQSMRGIVPQVLEAKNFGDSIKNKEPVAFFACLEEKKSLASQLDNKSLDNKSIEKIDLWIGPEGGFTDKEKKSMQSRNIMPFTLGPRVLRSETASIASIVNLLMYYQR